LIGQDGNGDPDYSVDAGVDLHITNGMKMICYRIPRLVTPGNTWTTLAETQDLEPSDPGHAFFPTPDALTDPTNIIITTFPELLIKAALFDIATAHGSDAVTASRERDFEIELRGPQIDETKHKWYEQESYGRVTIGG
jgi:hypothetical protein